MAAASLGTAIAGTAASGTVRRPAAAAGTGTGTGRKAVGLVGTVLAIALGIYVVRDRLPSVTSVVDLLTGAQPFWLAVAMIATAVATLAFSFIQRRLVTDLGGDLSRPRSVELTLTSGAISMALPAGSALGAGYTYRRLRRAGLTSADAGVTMVGSAGLLTATLLVLYLLMSGPTLIGEFAAVIGGNAVTALLLIIIVLAGLGIRRARGSAHSRGNHSPVFPATVTVPPAGGRFVRLAAAVAAGVHTLRRYLQTLRITAASLPGATWRSGAGWALVKWAADFAVLAGAVLAVGADVGLVPMASVYVAVQVLRQVPVTPGGVGVIEAALLAGLVAAGAAAAPAAAAVVIYRGLTLWMVLATGAVVAVAFRPPPARNDSPAVTPLAAGGLT